MDDDPVLRALCEDLERDDPDLAAWLTAGPAAALGEPLACPHPLRLLGLLTLTAVVAVAAPFLLGPAVFGVMALLVLVGCPLAMSRWLPATAAGPGDDARP